MGEEERQTSKRQRNNYTTQTSSRYVSVSIFKSYYFYYINVFIESQNLEKLNKKALLILVVVCLCHQSSFVCLVVNNNVIQQQQQAAASRGIFCLLAFLFLFLFLFFTVCFVCFNILAVDLSSLFLLFLDAHKYNKSIKQKKKIFKFALYKT